MIGVLTWIAFGFLALGALIHMATSATKPREKPSDAVGVALGVIVNILIAIIVAFAAATLVSLGA